MIAPHVQLYDAIIISHRSDRAIRNSYISKIGVFVGSIGIFGF